MGRNELAAVSLVATDLDGTLLTSDDQVTARTVQAIHAAQQAGIDVIVVTGRPPRWLPPVLDALEIRPLCVCANGAITIDAASESVVHIEALSPEDVLHAADVLRTLLPQVGFAIERAPIEHALWDHVSNFAHDDEYHPRWPTVPGTIVAELADIVSERPVLKLLARSDRDYAQAEVDDILARTRDALGQRLEVTHSERDRLLLEMSAPGVDKGVAVARVARDRGLSAANVAAIGDMLNDLPMIEWAGFGFTVTNGHEALRAIAPALASNDDEAVAQLIEMLIAARSHH